MIRWTAFLVAASLAVVGTRGDSSLAIPKHESPPQNHQEEEKPQSPESSRTEEESETKSSGSLNSSQDPWLVSYVLESFQFNSVVPADKWIYIATDNESYDPPPFAIELDARSSSHTQIAHAHLIPNPPKEESSGGPSITTNHVLCVEYSSTTSSSSYPLVSDLQASHVSDQEEDGRTLLYSMQSLLPPQPEKNEEGRTFASVFSCHGAQELSFSYRHETHQQEQQQELLEETMAPHLEWRLSLWEECSHDKLCSQPNQAWTYVPPPIEPQDDEENTKVFRVEDSLPQEGGWKTVRLSLDPSYWRRANIPFTEPSAPKDGTTSQAESQESSVQEEEPIRRKDIIPPRLRVPGRNHPPDPPGYEDNTITIEAEDSKSETEQHEQEEEEEEEEPFESSLNLRRLKGWRLELWSTLSFSSILQSVEASDTIVAEGGATKIHTGSWCIHDITLHGNGDLLAAPWFVDSWEDALDLGIVADSEDVDPFPMSDNEQETSEPAPVEEQTMMSDGQWSLHPYRAQQQTGGGFRSYDFVVPGRAYYNLSKATYWQFQYCLEEPASTPGRLDLDWKLLDASQCPDMVDCGYHFTAWGALIPYHSQHDILDRVPEGLEKNDNAQETCCTGGTSTCEHCGLQRIALPDDAHASFSMVKGYRVGLALDEQGEIGSTVTGAVSFCDLAVSNSIPSPPVDNIPTDPDPATSSIETSPEAPVKVPGIIQTISPIRSAVVVNLEVDLEFTVAWQRQEIDRITVSVEQQDPLDDDEWYIVIPETEIDLVANSAGDEAGVGYIVKASLNTYGRYRWQVVVYPQNALESPVISRKQRFWLEEAPTLGKLLMVMGDLSLVRMALRETEVFSHLGEPSQTFTLFAPTNAAVRSLGYDVLKDLYNEEDPSILKSIALTHMIPGKALLFKDLKNGTLETSLQGSFVEVIKTSRNTAFVKGSGNAGDNRPQIVFRDIQGSNGVIHVVDAVIDNKHYDPPSSVSLATMIQSTELLSIFFYGLQLTNLLSRLEYLGETPPVLWTVFCPRNDAFERVGQEQLDFWFGDTEEGRSALEGILLNHIVPGMAYAASNADAERVSIIQDHDTNIPVAFWTSAAGGSLQIVGPEEGTTDLYVKGAGNYAEDMPRIIDYGLDAVNGMGHVINQLIAPME